MIRYWLVFCDAEEWYLRIFRRGFRHVWIHGLVNGTWFSVDLRAATIDLEVTPAAGTTVEGIMDFWRESGFTAIEVKPRRKPQFVGLLTCVGMCKRFLGMRAWWVQTPHQLYKMVAEQKYGWTT